MGQRLQKDSSRNQQDKEEDKDDATCNGWKIECMGESMSFHGSMGKMEAVSKLREHGGTCFLTRYNEETKVYMLSVMVTGVYRPTEQFEEFQISIKKYSFMQVFSIEGKKDMFGTIAALLEFYQNSRGKISRAITSIGEEVKRPLSIQETFDGNMRESISFHGPLDEMEAEIKLREHGGDCFLTRYSKAEKVHMLSVMANGEKTELRVNAMKINSLPQFSIEGREKWFHSVVILLDYYQKNRISETIYSIGEELQRPNIMTSNITPTGREHEAFSAPAMRAVPLWEIQGFSRDPSYHGVMKGKEAEDMLKEHDRDHYLTRYSEARSKYVLTIKRRDQVVNFDLGIETGEHGVLYEIVGTEVKFGELRKLLDFYRNNPVSHKIRGIGDYLISDNYVPNDSTDGVGYTYYSHTNEDSASATISAGKKSCGFHKHSPSSSSQYLFPSPSHPKPNLDLLAPPSYQRSNSASVSSPTQNRSNADTFFSHRPHSSFNPSTSHQYKPDRPSLSNLSVYKWTSSSGEAKKLSIIDQVSAKWRRIGVLIGLNMTELDTIEQKTLRDNDECCQRVFSKWFENGGNQSYPITWEGLQELLKDAQMRTVATQLQEAIDCPAH